MRPEEAVVISLLSIPELAFESNKPVTNQLGPAASRPAQEAGRGVPLDQPDRGRSDELCGRPDQASYVGRLYRLGAAPVDSHRQQAPSLRPPEVEQRQAADQLHRTSGALQKSFKFGQLSTHRSVQHVGPSSRLHTTYWVYHRAPTLTIMDRFDSTARHISGALSPEHMFP